MASDRFWKFFDDLSRGAERFRHDAIDRAMAAGDFLSARRMVESATPRNLRIFRLTLASFLYLSVTIAGIAADNNRATWSLWLPMPLSLAVITIGLFDPKAFYPVGRLLIGGLIGAWIVMVRLWLAQHVPVPYLAMRETMELVSALMIALAFWLTAGRRPVLCYVSLIAALGTILLTRVWLSDLPILFRPDMPAVLISLFWAFVAFGGVLSDRSRPGLRPTGERAAWGITPAHIVALFFGATVGWICMRYSANINYDNELVTRGQEAVRLLWTKSFLLGWGRESLPSLGGVLLDPMDIQIPAWMGWAGTLSAYGLSSAVGSVGLAMGLAWWAYRRGLGGLSIGTAPQLGLLAAQAILAMHVVGGPNSSLPLFIIMPWLGLGLTPMRPAAYRAVEKIHPYPTSGAAPAEGPARPPGFSLIRMMSAFVTLVVLFAACIVCMGPAWGRSYVLGLKSEAIKNPSKNRAIARRLYLAKTLSPWDAKIDLAEGMRLREELDRTPLQQWNENLYQRACDAYRHAQQNDPYDPLITLELARLQQTARRNDDATQTILRGLAINPSAMPLIEWLFFFASSQKNTDVALDMIDLGLKIEPYSAKWWERRHRFEMLLGHGPEAGMALNRALTADPTNHDLLASAFTRRERAMQAAQAEKRP